MFEWAKAEWSTAEGARCDRCADHRRRGPRRGLPGSDGGGRGPFDRAGAGVHRSRRRPRRGGRPRLVGFRGRSPIDDPSPRRSGRYRVVRVRRDPAHVRRLRAVSVAERLALRRPGPGRQGVQRARRTVRPPARPSRAGGDAQLDVGQCGAGLVLRPPDRRYRCSAGQGCACVSWSMRTTAHASAALVRTDFGSLAEMAAADAELRSVQRETLVRMFGVVGGIRPPDRSRRCSCATCTASSGPRRRWTPSSSSMDTSRRTPTRWSC